MEGRRDAAPAHQFMPVQINARTQKVSTAKPNNAISIRMKEIRHQQDSTQDITASHVPQSGVYDVSSPVNQLSSNLRSYVGDMINTGSNGSYLSSMNREANSADRVAFGAHFSGQNAISPVDEESRK